MFLHLISMSLAKNMEKQCMKFYFQQGIITTLSPLKLTQVM